MSDNTKIEWSDAKKKKRAYDRNRYLALRERLMASREPDPIEQISDCEIAYIAGLIDGEGSIYVMKHREKTFYPAVSICMTHAGVLAWLAGKLGLSVSSVPRTPIKWRNQFSVRIHGVRAVYLCRRMLPYLKVKREQAELLQQFPCNERKAPGIKLAASVNLTRRMLMAKVNGLNARGVQE